MDLPSRLHEFGYGINFADGHAKILTFKDRGKYAKWDGVTMPPIPNPHDRDWKQIADVSTQSQR